MGIQKTQKRDRKLSYKEKLEFDGLEEEIAKLETEKQELTEQLYDPDIGEKAEELGKKLSQVIKELEEKAASQASRIFI